MELIVDGQVKKEFQAPFLKEKDCVVKICSYEYGTKIKYIEKEEQPQKAVDEAPPQKAINLGHSSTAPFRASRRGAAGVSRQSLPERRHVPAVHM